MDANTANTEAAKKRLTALRTERDSAIRIERDKANVAALEAQISALEPLAAAAATQPAAN